MYLFKKIIDLVYWIVKIKTEQVILHWLVFKLTYKIQKYILN